MRTHAYALQFADGKWFAGFSGVPDETGKPRINLHGDLSKCRHFNSATAAEAAIARLAARGVRVTLYVLRAVPVSVEDSKANDATVGR